MTSVTTRPRRGRGEGTYDTLPSGMIRLRVRVPDGGRLTFMGTSKQDCQEQYHRAIAARPDGRLVMTSKASVGQWLDQWLEDHVRLNAIESPRTYTAYESCVRTRLKPELGRVQLGKLSAAHIQRAYAKLAQRLAPKTVTFTHNVLHLALEAARRQRLISHNPSDDVDLPKRADPRPEERALSQQQLAMLLGAMAGHEYESLWRFLIGTGTRWGEAAALRWSDVDLTPGHEQVTIQRALVTISPRLRTTADPRKLRTGPPKTRRGRRTIPLVPDTVAALKTQQARVRELRKQGLELGYWNATEGDLVFPGTQGGLLHANYTRDAFRAVCARAGLPAKRQHDLRHSYATLLFASDVHPRIAMELLGHAAIGVTMDMYTASVPAATRAAVLRLSDAFGRPS